jgi:hypothetical protein
MSRSVAPRSPFFSSNRFFAAQADADFSVLHVRRRFSAFVGTPRRPLLARVERDAKLFSDSLRGATQEFSRRF